jgi:hypothetical protein
MHAFPTVALLAIAALAAAPAAAADPLPTCYRDPCVEQGASAGSGGADASVTVYSFMGTGVAVHASPDAVYVVYAQGIARCTFGVDLSPPGPIYGCVF